MEKKIPAKVADAISHYPDEAVQVFNQVRDLVMVEAKKSVGLQNTEETLKWGEPSYLAEGGSTVRMKWSDKSPDQFSLFFNCNSRLVETFRELYQEEFSFDGNRAISFEMETSIPDDAISHCLSMALQYHKLKKLPLLGA